MLQAEVGEYSNETLVSLGPTCVLPNLTLPQPLPASRQRTHLATLTPCWEQFPNTKNIPMSFLITSQSIL
jgi:hypothetical protein